MRKLVFFIISAIAFCGLPSAAQETDAVQLLDRVADAFRRAGGVEMAFTVSSDRATGKGTIRLKGDKFMLDTEEVKTWFDGRTQWSYLLSSEEVNISEPTAEELQTINPYSLLYIYKQGDYRVAMGKSSSLNGVPVYEIILSDKGRKRELSVIGMYLRKSDYQPLQVYTSGPGGRDAVSIRIDSYRTGQHYPDELFVFDKRKYPEAEVIDLR